MPTIERPRTRLASLLVPLLLVGCAHAQPTRLPGDLRSPYSGYRSAHYAAANAWLCRPDLDHDPCRSADLSAIEFDGDRLDASGHRPLVRAPPAESPPVDCFYVYPTVDLRLLPGNHTDFSDLQRITAVTLAQVGRFRTLCRMFVPLYRQATIGSYLVRDSDRYLSVGASDVEDAFLHYLGQYNQGRKVVLIGHSQGAEMITRLLKRRFDDDPALRDRLLVALVIGGRITVAQGKTTGGSFAKVPICTARAQTGCVVGYRSYLDGVAIDAGPYLPPRGEQTVCVDPLGGDGSAPRPFRGALLPSHGGGLDLPGVETPYLLFRGTYAGRCVVRDDGFAYLAVSSVASAPVHPIDIEDRRFRGGLGLHILDFQLPQSDLISLVRAKIAAVAPPP